MGEVPLYPTLLFFFSFLYYSRALSKALQQCTSLQYEPSSEALHISVKQLFLYRELYLAGHNDPHLTKGVTVSQ